MLKLRTDAAQNRADILAAADLVFAECGVTAPLDLVCKQAGVGRATLYRNFPDRHGLLLALLDRSINEMEDKARSLGEAPNAFFKLLRFQAERISARSSLVDYWRVIDREAPEIRRARQRMHALIKPHLERAVSAKLCRADLNDEDISLLTSMLGAALRGRTPDEQVGLGMRALDLIIEGLRPGTNRP
ncbi:MAG TPA: TetR/AcrR family transcriptional regulator [Aurantimonas coralicida]|jgi:AcrR family transcriptional regulator|uniref:TetR family transcriptional regulator n=3 Tax=root TaxID=1 RepID=A0A6N9TDM6_9HYPH|nr:TetR/AcrR family transcriptional regulator [Jiella pacifica]MAU43285.1 TetR family transcriptional regulator [Salipiger sp.]HDZ73768.1 TetR/AcrR family transcriptional regulator [Aurantimonas coralicida]MAU43312.1 TetR family transcriptional regulator [Salipiger sp.]NDW07779.1 TetR family transcriptional regulator [Jiella pacifica]HEU02210.1 TetR/AcrR family transcriptional regulator [Aurantimonas coralicida]